MSRSQSRSGCLWLPSTLSECGARYRAFLRAAGRWGETADGFFGSVFAIGEIKVFGGNQVLLGLPQNVLSRSDRGIDQVVKQAVCSVLGKACQVRFVDKETLAKYAAEPPLAAKTGPGPVSKDLPSTANVSASLDERVDVEQEAQAAVQIPIRKRSLIRSSRICSAAGARLRMYKCCRRTNRRDQYGKAST